MGSYSTVKDTGLFCAVLAEIFVLIPTWQATYQARKAFRDSSGIARAPVSRMLLRDGQYLCSLVWKAVTNRFFHQERPTSGMPVRL